MTKGVLAGEANFGRAANHGVMWAPTLGLPRDGPNGLWTPSPNAFADDRRAVHERQHAEQVENLGDARCGGMVEVEGRKLLHYGFTTKTNPDEAQNGMWFGATSDVYLDPETMEVVRWEMTDFTSSFAPGAMKQKSVEDFDYDDSIVVDPPD